MEQEPNQAGGQTIWLIPEEDLADAPASHRGLITAGIRQAFASPKQYFLELASRVPFPAFQQYLEQLVSGGRCALLLATADEMFGGPRVAFQWWTRTPGPMQLLIEPGASELDPLPASGFEGLFSQVRWIHWAEIGCGGGLFCPGEHPTLKHYGAACENKLFPPSTTRIFGSSSCGDMLIYNASGEAGYLSHENGRAYSLGKVTEALDWIFNELRQGREPAFDYERVR